MRMMKDRRITIRLTQDEYDAIVKRKQMGRRKLAHDAIRHGSFIIIVEQRNYSLYKAMDALFGVPVFSYSVLDTMNVHAL